MQMLVESPFVRSSFNALSFKGEIRTGDTFESMIINLKDIKKDSMLRYNILLADLPYALDLQVYLL
jgi:hypothetical protein